MRKKLPRDDYSVTNLSDVKDGVYLLAKVVNVKKDDIDIIDSSAYIYSGGGEVGSVMKIFEENLAEETRTRKYEEGRKGIMLTVEEISKEEYKERYANLSVECANCHSIGVIRGNVEFQKGLGQIPGTKKKFYSCGSSCKREFKKKLKEFEGELSTKKKRERFHKEFNKDVFGYIYGVHHKKKDMWYIGKTIQSPFARWGDHLMTQKYLVEEDIRDLEFLVIDLIKISGNYDEDMQRLWDLEKEYVNKYDCIENGFNTQMPSKYSSIDRAYQEFTYEELVNMLIKQKGE